MHYSLVRKMFLNMVGLKEQFFFILGVFDYTYIF